MLCHAMHPMQDCVVKIFRCKVNLYATYMHFYVGEFLLQKVGVTNLPLKRILTLEIHKALGHNSG
jgi:hypothetical protein